MIAVTGRRTAISESFISRPPLHFPPLFQRNGVPAQDPENICFVHVNISWPRQ